MVLESVSKVFAQHTGYILCWVDCWLECHSSRAAITLALTSNRTNRVCSSLSALHECRLDHITSPALYSLLCMLCEVLKLVIRYPEIHTNPLCILWVSIRLKNQFIKLQYNIVCTVIKKNGDKILAYLHLYLLPSNSTKSQLFVISYS